VRDGRIAQVTFAGQHVSDATAQRVDAEIKSLIDGIEQHARQFVDENRDRLERLAKRLLEAETLSREQIDEVLNR
jgi:cell division protease FtsH